MDDIFEASVRHDSFSASVALRASRTGASTATFDVEFEDVSSAGAARWLPGSMVALGDEGVYRARSALRPSASHSLADAIAMFNNGTFWVVEVVDGYPEGLSPLAHASLSALRKAHIGALLADMKREIVSAAASSPIAEGARTVSLLAQQVRQVGRNYGLLLLDERKTPA